MNTSNGNVLGGKAVVKRDSIMVIINGGQYLANESFGNGWQVKSQWLSTKWMKTNATTGSAIWGTSLGVRTNSVQPAVRNTTVRRRLASGSRESSVMAFIPDWDILNLKQMPRIVLTHSNLILASRVIKMQATDWTSKAYKNELLQRSFDAYRQQLTSSPTSKEVVASFDNPCPTFPSPKEPAVLTSTMPNHTDQCQRLKFTLQLHEIMRLEVIPV